MSLTGKRILLGITGGIAAYKAAVLLRELQKSGAEVRCIVTPSALRFIGKDTLAALTRQPVPSDVFPDDADIGDSWVRHIHWAEWADLFLIAPCTANSLAKIANGISDNMLTSAVLAARCPIMICPTMDGGMYDAPATQANLKKITGFGYHLIEPESGYLASGIEDKGRLPDYPVILDAISSVLSDSQTDLPLSGKTVLVTAGPTREFIDPVRFISNPSTGKMGIAMAAAAKKLGADVHLVHGPLSVPVPDGIKTTAVVSAQNLFETVSTLEPSDICILSAAVSDFTPTETHEHKIKKTASGDSQQIQLKRTPDTLKWLGENKRDGQVLIGFAMETENVIKEAQRKRKEKKADWIISNSVLEHGSGFAHDTNSVNLIGNDEPVPFQGRKDEIALKILSYIFG